MEKIYSSIIASSCCSLCASATSTVFSSCFYMEFITSVMLTFISVSGVVARAIVSAGIERWEGTEKVSMKIWKDDRKTPKMEKKSWKKNSLKSSLIILYKLQTLFEQIFSSFSFHFYTNYRHNGDGLRYSCQVFVCLQTYWRW